MNGDLHKSLCVNCTDLKLTQVCLFFHSENKQLHCTKNNYVLSCQFIAVVNYEFSASLFSVITHAIFFTFQHLQSSSVPLLLQSENVVFFKQWKYKTHRKNQQGATVQQNLLFRCFLIAQHVSGDTPPIIRSSKTVIAASGFTHTHTHTHTHTYIYIYMAEPSQRPDLPFSIQANCSKCPPSAWITFLTRVTRELVTLRSTTVLCKVTSSLVTRVRKGIQADGGHFEQLV